VEVSFLSVLPGIIASVQTIRTFVVKVLRDWADPLALRGLLTCVATGDQFPYADGPALLELLMRISDAQESQWVSQPGDPAQDPTRQE